MFVLGLTGDIACGKSTVARMLAARGAAVLDADALVHELYADRNFARRVAALFESPGGVTSPPILTPDGTIDRVALGALVFRDAASLARLEAMVHPAVAELRERKIEELRARTSQAVSSQVVVLEAVKLIESGQAKICAAVWWVTSRPALQIRRLMEERGLSEAQARERLQRQPAPEAKRALLGATPLVVIENNGTLEDLERQVEAQWEKVLSFRF